MRTCTGRVLVVFLGLLPACVTLTQDPRTVILAADGGLQVRSLTCAEVVPPLVAPPPKALDPRALRLVTWNIHKQGDAGWERDLARIVAGSDIVLLQEAALTAALRPLLEDNELRWVMASSFLYEDTDFGVLTAARAVPLASCTERVVEPLLGIPKSGIVSWFPLEGRTETLAVVNVHAINFSLALDSYRIQFAALVRPLLAHRGPIVFAGDFNTWTADRLTTVRDVTAVLGLTVIPFADDERSRFFGRQVDHVMVRGLDVLTAAAIPVTSSDHNPVRVTLILSSPFH